MTMNLIHAAEAKPEDIDEIDDDREWAAAKREQADAEDHHQETMRARYAPKDG